MNPYDRSPHTTKVLNREARTPAQSVKTVCKVFDLIACLKFIKVSCTHWPESFPEWLHAKTGMQFPGYIKAIKFRA